MTIILTYHRVNSRLPPSDVWELTVSLERFEEQLDYLSSSRVVIPLAEYERCLATGNFPERSICICFDDGYYNNFSLAKPRLEDRLLPATIFLVTGFLGKGSFWWDRLEAAVSSGTPSDIHRAPDVEDHPTTESRTKREISRLWAEIRDFDLSSREAHLDRLCQILEVCPRLDPENRPMTVSEAQAVKSDLISIASHTMHHSWLPALSRAEIMREIISGKECCEELLGNRIISLAYPYGAHDEITKSAAASAGISFAYTAGQQRAAGPGCDRLAIPRLAAQNWTAQELDIFIRDLER